jgi:drug/metabolite transporter (DMT)-like permease
LALAEGTIAGLLFGTAAVFIRFMQDLDAFAIAFWRLIIACSAIAFLLMFLGRALDFKLLGKSLKELIVLSVLLGLHFVFFVSAVKDTSILNAAVLVNTTPIFSVFVSSFLFKLKPSRIAVAGLIVSFIGVGVVALAETLTASSGSAQTGYSTSIKGDLEAILAALVETFYLSYGRNVRSRMRLLPVMCFMYLLAAVFVGVLGVGAARNVFSLPTNVAAMLALVGLGILPTAAAHTLYFSSLSNLKSFETAAMALLEPVGATILGMSLFQEIPAPLFALGATLILMGILFVVRNHD